MLRCPPRCVSQHAPQLLSLASTFRARCGYSSAIETNEHQKPGAKLHGFTLKASKHVPELKLTALHLQHDQTGAEYLHIAKDDKNNVFSIGFKTNPPDRTGVPHILEHVTLCGSEKYPVRDPFFKMMPRSLSNFMNAMTSSDNTIYPFATTNTQDYRNLMSVYLDATLHPLLKDFDFKQEGWRIGPEDPRKPVTEPSEGNPLLFKGVVYNEMKGQMSNADYLFQIRFQNHIFPSLQDSGGDPQKITDLTHEQLKQFHFNHYHPSNAKIFTYGNIPLTEHLKEIAPRLESFEKIQTDTELRLPITLSDGSKLITVPGPLDPLYPQDQQYKASVSWLTCNTSDVLETFSMSIISSLLLDGFASPLYKNTIEVGWGASLTPNTGFDPSGQIAIFSVGLSGLRKHDVARLNDGISNTLKSVKRAGFSSEKVEGRLHQIELSMKHKTAGFGLALMNRLQGNWFNNVNPLKIVSPEEMITAFRMAFKKKGYLEGLMAKYLLSDKTFTFVMEPSAGFAEGLVLEENARLKAKILQLSEHSSLEETQTKLREQELELMNFQDSTSVEAVDCLPSVHVEDISRIGETKALRFSSVGDTRVQWREAPTNGLTYFRAIRSFKNIPDDLRMYLPLFSSAIQRLGTASMSVEHLEDLTRLKTGGISIGHHASTSPYSLDLCEEGISYSGSALDGNIPIMYDILQKMLLETNFNGDGASLKIMELIKNFANSAINDVAEAGHSYARHFAEASLSQQARLDEQIGGMSQMRLLMDLASRSPHDRLEDVIEKLRMIQSFAISGGGSLRVSLTCGSESTPANETALEKFLSTLPIDISPPIQEEQLQYPRNAKSFFPLPYQVYYSSMALPTIPYLHKDGAPLQVLAQLLTNKYLHHEIREKGGAYGAGAYARGLGGIFGFYSYRDPNPQNSLKVMAQAGAWARDRQWSDRDIKEAKLSVFQNLDAPESVSQEGMAQFLHSIDQDMEQAKREQLLDVTAKHVNEVADRYLVDIEDNSSIALLGEKNEWINEHHGWLEIPMNQANQSPDGEGGHGYVVL